MISPIRPASFIDAAGWQALRARLWPDDAPAAHRAQIEAILTDPARRICILAGTERPVAFAEACLRGDYVNGCDTSPVLFLEGIYVAPPCRRRGIARALCASLQDWGVERKVTEFASDAPIGNRASRALHRSLGFMETERVVYFRKLLDAT